MKAMSELYDSIRLTCSAATFRALWASMLPMVRMPRAT